MRPSIAMAIGLGMAAGTAMAGELPTAAPEEAGLSPQRLQRMSSFFKEESDKLNLPGAVVLLARNGKVGYFEAFGKRDVERQLPMEKDSLFRIYSMTKPITTTAVMMLWEEGRFRLTDPISRYIPAFKEQKVLVERVENGRRLTALVPVEREITIQDLLRHTSGLTYGGGKSAQEELVEKAGLKGDISAKNPMLTLTDAEAIDKIAKLPLLFQPGSSWEYGRSTDVLGRLVEVISGTTLDRFFAQRILGP